jgi:hypothetical protein
MGNLFLQNFLVLVTHRNVRPEILNIEQSQQHKAVYGMFYNDLAGLSLILISKERNVAYGQQSALSIQIFDTIITHYHDLGDGYQRVHAHHPTHGDLGKS